jgi:DNA-binding LytR/AlgR family response regulator
MKVLLVDDEIAARRRLARLLASFDDVEITEEAESGLEAVSLIESIQPDLVFLDVRMPEMNGFEVIGALSSAARMPLIIFATSYDDYALQAFNTNALAYLLKPIERPRLTAALERARKLLGSDHERVDDEHKIRSIIADVKPLTRIICRKLNTLLPVAPQDIFWFYTDNGLVRVKTATDDLWTNYQLHYLENSLDSQIFFRARRDVLLNLNRVKSLIPREGSTFSLIMSDLGETEIMVSERRAPELRNRLPGL